MECILAEIYGCHKSEKELKCVGVDRIKSIIQASKRRQDTLHIALEKQLQDDPSLLLQCHRDCVSTYTSSWHISRHLKRTVATTSCETPVKRTRRYDAVKFDFRQNCLYCGETCIIRPDPKNPKRWRKAVVCRTADRPGRQTFKDAILEVCALRNDEWSK